MKKFLAIPVLVMLCLLYISCEKEGRVQICHQVKYISEYCPATKVCLVSFSGPNKDATPIVDAKGDTVGYQMALLNIPDKFKVPEKVFYVKYTKASSATDFKICEKVDSVAVFVADSASEEDCSVSY